MRGPKVLLLINLLVMVLCVPVIYTGVDFIIFSYDRPMQLYALLESTTKYLTGVDSISVVYRASGERFANGYSIVQQDFSRVTFIRQGNEPLADFKHLTLKAFNSGSSQYILFAPDDIIVKNHADLNICIKAMEEFGAYGFFLRLGTHLTACYPNKLAQPVPPMQKVGKNLCLWAFKDSDARLDWGYPNNIDMTVYRKSDIQSFFQTSDYTGPNILEWRWSVNGTMHTLGLCFEESIVVNIPVNLVQDVWTASRRMSSWSPFQLLEKLESGERIDIRAIQGIKNESCHIEYELQFLQKNSVL